MAHLQFLLLVIVSLIQIDVCTSYCPQLGCDGAGTFNQVGFKVPIDGKRKIAWMTTAKTIRMNDENENYGCVGSSKVVVCPYQQAQPSGSRHIMMNADTGVEYDTTGYDTLHNVNMPILTKNNEVFATNNTHASLVDPINKRSFITKLPTDNPNGMHSPLYLEDLGFFIVFGNFSESFSIYIIVAGSDHIPVLDLLTTFKVAKTGKTCSWLSVTEMTSNGNRAYFYGIQKDEITGVVALDFMKEAPYYKKAWELSDEVTKGILSTVPSKSKEREDNSDSCVIIPEIDPDYSIFPPVDVNIQMLATPDKYVVITSPVGLMTMKDHGDSGEQVAISLFGAHFLSLDTSTAVSGKAPIVWMTGWQQYPPFREFLIAYNYSDTDGDESDSIWTLEFHEYLEIDGINITSRVSTFDLPGSAEHKVSVFGASVNNTNVNSTFLKKYCTECAVGINHVVMAVRTEPTNTASPLIYWVTKISSTAREVRGQIIGVSDKLVMYIGQPGGGNGNIIALK